jgi:hypothetical protein
VDTGNTNQQREIAMKANSYLRHIKPANAQAKNSWYTVKAGAGALVAMTTPADEQFIAGDVSDMSTMDPADLLIHFEDYEDSEFDGEEWVL